MKTTLATIACAAVLATASPAPAEPIRLHPDNPHYFEFRGKPTVLITSGEHYGAVLNRDFDYRRYFETLASYGFNLTRTFTGAYCEPPGAFKIQDNTLAPAKGRLVCPWARSDTPGYANGGNKFDLTRWDPDYFDRLRDMVARADRHGIVVELVFFCPFYRDEMWVLSPMNAANNVNGIGKLRREEVYTLKDRELTRVQDAMVRKIVRELARFDNLYYEICNEPYFGGVTLEWQAHVARTIAATERELGVAHLIAQNIANKSKKIEDPDPHVSIFNFHYATPPTAVTINYHLNKPIGDDETGFRGREPKPYRVEGWEFLLAGGAVYSNLDYSFTCGHEDGSATSDAPGGGGPEIQKQLALLKRFIEGFDFVRMRPDHESIQSVAPAEARATVLAERGRAYAIYVGGPGPATLVVDLPPGRYTAEWVNTKTGKVERSERFEHPGGDRKLASPGFTDDIALRVVARA
jgi:hypothetical protein